eukprot:5921805-Prymnesium_polylepis.1
MQWRVGESGEQAWVQWAGNDSWQRRTASPVVVLGVPLVRLQRGGRLMTAIVLLELATGAWSAARRSTRGGAASSSFAVASI